MDYKYIDQLLERYWNCETTTEEEEILRAFFRQKEIPMHLLRYRSLFVYEERQKEVRLGDDFDRRILAEIERPIVKAKRLTLRTRFMPLLKAAAMMALLFTVGGVVKHSMEDERSGIVYVYGQFDNHSTDSQVAEADTTRTSLKVAAENRGQQAEKRK